MLIKILILMFCIFTLIGCAGLKNLFNDVGDINQSEAANIMQEPISAIVLPLIPQPYQIPASIVIGYAIALIRGWYKKKQGAK